MATDSKDMLAHMRYMAMMARRSAPPRCNPVSILWLVLSGGVIFIGLTMTVIANWPGYTSMSNNPLKIAGPVLLSAGTIAFICGIIMACILNGREQRRWSNKMNNYAIAASRQALNQSNTSLDKDRAGNIYEKYKPSDVPEGDDGPRSTQYLLGEHPDGYQHDTSSTFTDEYKKNGEEGFSFSHTEPAAVYPGNTRPHVPNLDGSDSFDLPTPIRVGKKKKKDVADSSSTENLKSPGMDKLGSSTPGSSSGFDEDLFGDPVDAEVPSAIRKTKKKKRTAGSKEKLNAAEDERLMQGSSSDSNGVKRPIGSSSSKDDESGRDLQKKPNTSVKPPPSPGETYRLRVQVKTDPGASVYIHQGSSTPPQQTWSTFKSNGNTEL